MALRLDVIYTRDSAGEKGIKILPNNSIDLMATDPQYGWNFMGKDWDMAVPSVDIWQECFRVLKPGAFAFIMSGPRLDCLIENGMRIREAGFMISFSPIFWAFASGFPKAQNIGKAVDKRLGAKRKVIGQKTCGYQVSISKKRHEEGYRPNLTKATKEVDITLPATPQAQALDGSYGGFQPKPAVEIIIVAMKPLSEKTYLDQALKNRKGITWLDKGRIPYKNDYDEKHQEDIQKGQINAGKGKFFGGKGKSLSSGNLQGRFPANLLCSDDVLNDGRVSKSNTRQPTGHQNIYDIEKGWNQNQVKDTTIRGMVDSGSFSRYFSLDVWFEKKLKELPAGLRQTFPYLICPKASKREKNRGCENLYWEKDNSSFGYHQIDRQRWEWLGKEEERIYKKIGKKISLRTKGNIHPTVKPLKLGFYLATIGSREGDVILDPFGGSGWMAIVAKALKRHYIIFEMIKENVKIAKTRLLAEKTLWD